MTDFLAPTVDQCDDTSRTTIMVALELRHQVRVQTQDGTVYEGRVPSVSDFTVTIDLGHGSTCLNWANIKDACILGATAAKLN